MKKRVWIEGDDVTPEDMEEITNEPELYIQQADPSVTDPAWEGAALWFVTDGAGNVTDIKVRSANGG